MKQPIARIYQWASSDATELAHQDALRVEAQAMGYTVTATYSEEGAGAWGERPQLQRLLNDLKEGDTIIVEHLNRITLLPLDKVVALVGILGAKGATVSIPGLLDLSHTAKGPAVIVRETMQAMLLKVVLYQCRSHWEARSKRQEQVYDIAR
ncbi:recombinase family protein [Massilia sp. CMS3.1]|uniref:recombinase family protein n=1 Tax=Massilia sp. CMS3.1 TaxID=3373083 RepID=UPI003EE7CA30